MSKIVTITTRVLLWLFALLPAAVHSQEIADTDDKVVEGQPFQNLQEQIIALGNRLDVVESLAGDNYRYLDQINSNVGSNSLAILSNSLKISNNQEGLDKLEAASKLLTNCAEVKAGAVSTFTELSDALEQLQDGGFVQLSWSYYSLDSSNDVVVTDQTATLDANGLSAVIKEADRLSTCKANEQDIMHVGFSSWTERNRQLEALLGTLLRIIKDVTAIGLGAPSAQ